jgi:hypothetical protein
MLEIVLASLFTIPFSLITHFILPSHTTIISQVSLFLAKVASSAFSHFVIYSASVPFQLIAVFNSMSIHNS